MTFQLECADKSFRVDDAGEGDVRDVFAHPEARGEHVILLREDGSFLHAAGEGDGPFLLIFHEEPVRRSHQAAEPVEREEAEQAFIDYLHGRSAWWDDREWFEVRTSWPITFYLGIACLIFALLLLIAAYLVW